MQAWNLKDKIAVTGRVSIKMCNYGMTIIFIFYFWFHTSCLKNKSVPKREVVLSKMEVVLSKMPYVDGVQIEKEKVKTGLTIM